MRNSCLVAIPGCCFHLSEQVTAGHHRPADTHTHTEVQGVACWGLLPPPTHINTSQCGLTGSISALRAPEGSFRKTGLKHLQPVCIYETAALTEKDKGIIYCSLLSCLLCFLPVKVWIYWLEFLVYYPDIRGQAALSLLASHQNILTLSTLIL